VWKDEKAAEIEECERQRGHYQHLSEIQERELKSLQSELDRLQRQLDAAEAELGTAKLSIASLEASRAVTPPNGDDGTTEAEAAVQDSEPVICLRAFRCGPVGASAGYAHWNDVVFRAIAGGITRTVAADRENVFGNGDCDETE
jgi:hypothetical protein